MAVLPTELIIEILSKLPVKTLLRFLCVCKYWYTLIKSTNFINTHLNNQTLISNSDLHLLLFYPSFRSAELDLHSNQLSFSEIHHPLQLQELNLFGSCNGVVCFSDVAKNDVVMFNPLTKSHRKLKLPSVSISPDYIASLEWFWFGYEGGNKDYKLLRMVETFEEPKIRMNKVVRSILRDIVFLNLMTLEPKS